MHRGAIFMWLLIGACTTDAPIEGPCDGDAGDESVLRVCVETSERTLAFFRDNPDEREERAASVVINGVRVEDVEMEVHGGLARTFEKLSYRLRFDPEGTDVDFFGDGPERVRRIVLQASWIDRSFSRAKIAMDLTRSEGGLAPRVGFVQLFLNGEWHGLYLAIERVDDVFLERNGLTTRDAFTYKAESNAATWGLHEDPLEGFAVRGGGDDSDDNDEEERLEQFFRAMLGAELTEAAYDAEVAPRLDLADWNAWHTVMTFVQNSDTFAKNYYLHLAPDVPARIIQWDADACLGNYWDGTPQPATDLPRWFGEPNRFATNYFRVPEYRDAYLQGYEAALADEFLPANTQARAAAIADQVRPFAERDLAKWQPDYLFDDEVERLRSFLADRHEVMADVVETL